MDWLPGFKDWLFSNLDLLANLGSLAGFVSAVIIFFRARTLRKHYMLLTRGGKLLGDLNRHSSVLNDLLDTFIFLKDPRSERQIKDELEIVLKLNKLTKQGKIAWARGISLDLMGVRYAGKFKDRSYYLTSSPVVQIAKGIQDPEPSPATNAKFGLLIRESDGDKEIWIPSMPVVDDLVRTIRHQMIKGDAQDLDEVLKDLEEAENLLEE